ncbi:MAG: ABC transporter permease [Acutalibacteraceae bacterium]
MGAIFNLALIELRKKKFYTVLTFTVCLLAMYMIVSSITTVTSSAYQQKIFEKNLGYDMSKVLHLDFKKVEETDEFVTVLTQYKQYIKGLPGVNNVGQFDATGIYFSQLKASEKYCRVNAEIVKGGRYADDPEIAQLLRVDESLLSLMKGGITEYTQTTSGNLPIYASAVFEEVLPLGTLLTDEGTGEVYEVAAYIEKGSVWADENDLIRFPLDSLDGRFMAPWSPKSKSDIMTQLSALHNTYVLFTDDADIEYLKEQIHNYSLQHNFEAIARTLSEEYEEYTSETMVYTKRHIGLAVFLSAMAISSIIAVFTTNALLKRKQYGVFIANGLTLKDVVFCIATEISIIIFSSVFLAWGIKLAELLTGKDIFRDVLLTAHIEFTLPICLIIGVLLVIIASTVPALKIFKYQPCELIGGNTNGNY